MNVSCNPHKKIKDIQAMPLIFLLLLYTVLSQKINLRQPLFGHLYLIQFLFSRVKLVVSSLLREKVGVVAALDYLALFENHYRVCVANG